MTLEASLTRLRRLVLWGLGILLLLFLAAGAWFLTRRVVPGEFVIRLAPASAGSRFYQLSLRGPGGAVVGRWVFEGVPGPKILAGLQKKVPWAAISTNTSPARPCVTVEVPAPLPEEVLAPVVQLALSECCPSTAVGVRCTAVRVIRSR